MTSPVGGGSEDLGPRQVGSPDGERDVPAAYDQKVRGAKEMVDRGDGEPTPMGNVPSTARWWLGRAEEIRHRYRICRWKGWCLHKRCGSGAGFGAMVGGRVMRRPPMQASLPPKVQFPGWGKSRVRS